MIWLRHELWEHDGGVSYRLASRTGSAVFAATHPDAVLKQVFYAPSPAAAQAQYHALVGLGPHIPGSDVPHEGYGREALGTQLAEFPEDTVLAGQPALHPHAEASVEQAVAPIADPSPPVAQVEATTAPGLAEAAVAEPDMAEPEPAETIIPEAANPVAAPEAAPPAPLAATPMAAAPMVAPSPIAEQAAAQPVSVPPAAYDPLDLWPVAVDEVPAPRWARRRKRKPNVFLVVLRFLILLIVLAAVVIGIGIVTGVLDGPALLAQVRDLSVVQRVLPSA